LRAHTESAPPFLVRYAVLALAQLLARAFADVDGANGGEAELLALFECHPEESGEVVGR
jgi:hypothetical protein